MDKLFAYKVRPATDSLPGKFETGTQNHEGIAGVLGAVEYFQWVGRQFGGDTAESRSGNGYKDRILDLKKAMAVIHAYELEFSRALLPALQSIPNLRIYGLTDSGRLEERVPTYSFRLKDLPPRKLAEHLAKENIYVWDGNYYAINVTERLGVEDSGCMLRLDAVHYNTLDEVERLKNVLLRIAAS